jgi:hypothetical protein
VFDSQTFFQPQKADTCKNKKEKERYNCLFQDKLVGIQL